MKTDTKISSAVIKRLPRYRRYLEELDQEGVERISSGGLAEIIGYTASQIRQDLNNFGGFGQQGYGYNVKDLHDQICHILGLHKEYKVVVVGLGNMGRAMTNYIGSYGPGFHVEAIFDVDPTLIGDIRYGVEVKDFKELIPFLEENDIDIAIITAPQEAAQEVADDLVAGGIEGIWNFAPADIEVPCGVALTDVHLSDSLLSLVYYVNNPENCEGK